MGIFSKGSGPAPPANVVEGFCDEWKARIERGGKVPSGLQKLLATVRATPSMLPWLDLSKCPVDDSHVEALAETLRIWPVASKLDLRGSILTERALRSLLRTQRFHLQHAHGVADCPGCTEPTRYDEATDAVRSCPDCGADVARLPFLPWRIYLYRVKLDKTVVPAALQEQFDVFGTHMRVENSLIPFEGNYVTAARGRASIAETAFAEAYKAAAGSALAKKDQADALERFKGSGSSFSCSREQFMVFVGSRKGIECSQRSMWFSVVQKSGTSSAPLPKPVAAVSPASFPDWEPPHRAATGAPAPGGAGGHAEVSEASEPQAPVVEDDMAMSSFGSDDEDGAQGAGKMGAIDSSRGDSNVAEPSGTAAAEPRKTTVDEGLEAATTAALERRAQSHVEQEDAGPSLLSAIMDDGLSEEDEPPPPMPKDESEGAGGRTSVASHRSSGTADRRASHTSHASSTGSSAAGRTDVLARRGSDSSSMRRSSSGSARRPSQTPTSPNDAADARPGSAASVGFDASALDMSDDGSDIDFDGQSGSAGAMPRGVVMSPTSVDTSDAEVQVESPAPVVRTARSPKPKPRKPSPYEDEFPIVEGALDCSNRSAEALERLALSLQGDRAKQVTTLSLSNCGLSTRSLSTLGLPVLKALKQLDLSHNNLSTLPLGWHEWAPALVTLDVSHNAVVSLPSPAPEEFDNPDFNPPALLGLKRLDLSFNQLSTLSPVWLLWGQNVAVLNLSHNNLRRIPPLESCRSIVELSLGFNKIRTVMNLEHLSTLRRLDLGSNAITSAAGLRMLSLNKLVETLTLDGNAFTSQRRYRAQLLHFLPNLQSVDGQTVGKGKLEHARSLQKKREEEQRRKTLPRRRRPVRTKPPSSAGVVSTSKSVASRRPNAHKGKSDIVGGAAGEELDAAPVPQGHGEASIGPWGETSRDSPRATRATQRIDRPSGTKKKPIQNGESKTGRVRRRAGKTKLPRVATLAAKQQTQAEPEDKPKEDPVVRLRPHVSLKEQQERASQLAMPKSVAHRPSMSAGRAAFGSKIPRNYSPMKPMAPPPVPSAADKARHASTDTAARRPRSSPLVARAPRLLTSERARQRNRQLRDSFSESGDSASHSSYTYSCSCSESHSGSCGSYSSYSSGSESDGGADAGAPAADVGAEARLALEKVLELARGGSSNQEIERYARELKRRGLVHGDGRIVRGNAARSEADEVAVQESPVGQNRATTPPRAKASHDVVVLSSSDSEAAALPDAPTEAGRDSAQFVQSTRLARWLADSDEFLQTAFTGLQELLSMSERGCTRSDVQNYSRKLDTMVFSDSIRPYSFGSHGALPEDARTVESTWREVSAVKGAISDLLALMDVDAPSQTAVRKFRAQLSRTSTGASLAKVAGTAQLQRDVEVEPSLPTSSSQSREGGAGFNTHAASGVDRRGVGRLGPSTDRDGLRSDSAGAGERFMNDRADMALHGGREGRHGPADTSSVTSSVASVWSVEAQSSVKSSKPLAGAGIGGEKEDTHRRAAGTAVTLLPTVAAIAAANHMHGAVAARHGSRPPAVPEIRQPPAVLEEEDSDLEPHARDSGDSDSEVDLGRSPTALPRTPDEGTSLVVANLDASAGAVHDVDADGAQSTHVTSEDFVESATRGDSHSLTSQALTRLDAAHVDDAPEDAPSGISKAHSAVSESATGQPSEGRITPTSDGRASPSAPDLAPTAELGGLAELSEMPDVPADSDGVVDNVSVPSGSAADSGDLGDLQDSASDSDVVHSPRSQSANDVTGLPNDGESKPIQNLDDMEINLHITSDEDDDGSLGDSGDWDDDALDELALP